MEVTDLEKDPQTEGQGPGEDKKTFPKKEKRTVPPMTTIGDLIRAVYGGKQKVVSIKKGQLLAIKSSSHLEDTEREELLGLAESDMTLDRTRSLLLMCLGWEDQAYLTGKVRHFISQVLRRHPLFESPALTAVFENNSDAASEEAIIKVLLSQPVTSIQLPDGQPLTKKAYEDCRLNALCCLLLWFRESRGTSLASILRHLQKLLNPASHRRKTESESLRALMTTRDHSGVAIACSILDKQVYEMSLQMNSARRGEERANAQVKDLSQKLHNVSVELQNQIAENEALSQEIERLHRSHSDQKAHMRNEYEELRGRVLRTFKEELTMLDEGLHALHRDPPKVHVMVDHAERAIDGLKREMERIKGGE